MELSKDFSLVPGEVSTTAICVERVIAWMEARERELDADRPAYVYEMRIMKL